MQPPPSDRTHESPQGCLAKVQSLGLAMYAMLLLSFVAVGLVCGLGSLYALFRSSTTSNQGLVSGAQLEPWRLAEFRRLELIGQGETPSLYYDSSIAGDGSAGCLVAGEQLFSFKGGGSTHKAVLIGQSEVSVSAIPSGLAVVVTHDNQSLRCEFYSAEDGNRFADMLRAEARLAKPVKTENASE